MRNIIKHQINAWIKKVDVSSKAEYQRLLDAVMNECLYTNQHLDRDTFAARMSLSRLSPFLNGSMGYESRKPVSC